MIDSPSSGSASAFLIQWGKGDKRALEALIPIVYDELRRLARYHLNRQRPNHTLQSAALVNEVYLRFASEPSLQLVNRAHFFGVASQLMRWILVDYERTRRAAKRGGGQNCTLEDSHAVANGRPVDLLDLDRALTALSKLDPDQARIVEMRFFGGLSIEESAEALGLSPTTVKRYWSSARIYLFDALSGNADV
jgi:RNA polymerase sigma factor (TIGR02999 family)